MKVYHGDDATFRLPPDHCPSCGALIDAATDVEGPHRPEPGDNSICLYCASLLRYGADLRLELATLSEIPIQYRAKFAAAMRHAKELADKRK
jgi:hypothetical protein